MTRYEDRTKAELLELAADKNIEGRSNMSKDELIAALRGETPNEPEAAAPAEPDQPTGPFALPPDEPSVVGPGAVPIEQR